MPLRAPRAVLSRARSVRERLRPRASPPRSCPVAPEREFWLGTDRLFRDEFARLAVGARISLLIGVAATAIATAIGGVVGIVAGWFEGRLLDTALMRIVDIGLAFPFLLLVMALGAALDRTTPTTILLTLGLTGWLGTARIVRAKTMQIRDLDFVTARARSGRARRGSSSVTCCRTSPGRCSSSRRSRSRR